MVGGVLVQIVVMLCFTGILADFSYRYIKDKPTAQIHPFACYGHRQRQSAVSSASSQQTIINGGYNHRSERHVRFMLLGLSISTLFIFIRSIYRCVGLSPRRRSLYSFLFADCLSPSYFQVPRAPIGLAWLDHREPDALRLSRWPDDREWPRLRVLLAPG
jgi:hypothetical protein